MLSGLERPLAANETITLEVIVERGRGVTSRVNVEVAVRGVTGSDRSHAH
jgi:copper(I)-binding protein